MPLPACFNCRASVAPGSSTCPRCGTWFKGHPYTPRDDLSPREEGWGLPSNLVQSAGFRWASLLAPLWLPPCIMVWLGAPPVAVALMLALFIFIPGLYVITNLPGWSPWAKLGASLGYVAVSGSLGLVWMVWVGRLLRAG